MIRAALVAAIALAACKHSATGIPACDDHLAKRRACAKQIGGSLGETLADDADRLEASWNAARAKNIKNWQEKYAPKWCRAASDDARIRFPECAW